MGDSTQSAGQPGCAARPAGKTVVIGVGNEFRRDDGAGLQLVARLRDLSRPGVEFRLSDGEPAAMIEAWDGAALAVVVDAVQADPPVPGRLHRMIIGPGHRAPGAPLSSHGLVLSDVIGLATAIGRTPECLILHAVEVADVSHGLGLTPAVAAAMPLLTDAVLRDLA